MGREPVGVSRRVVAYRVVMCAPARVRPCAGRRNRVTRRTTAGALSPDVQHAVRADGPAQMIEPASTSAAEPSPASGSTPMTKISPAAPAPRAPSSSGTSGSRLARGGSPGVEPGLDHAAGEDLLDPAALIRVVRESWLFTATPRRRRRAGAIPDRHVRLGGGIRSGAGAGRPVHLGERPRSVRSCRATTPSAPVASAASSAPTTCDAVAAGSCATTRAAGGRVKSRTAWSLRRPASGSATHTRRDRAARQTASGTAS